MSDDKRKRELVRKVRHLVDSRFGSNYQEAFNHYAASSNRDGKVNRDELLVLLSDASVGNMISRGMWADGIMRELDRDGDNKISHEEFASVIAK